jgi:hypothetical protein
VQVRARVAEPPQRRPIRRTRPPRPGRRRRRAVPDREWPSRRTHKGRDPPEQHNPAPGGAQAWSYLLWKSRAGRGHATASFGLPLADKKGRSHCRRRGPRQSSPQS